MLKSETLIAEKYSPLFGVYKNLAPIKNGYCFACVCSLAQYFLTFFPGSWILPILRLPHDPLRGYLGHYLSEQFQAFLIG